MTFTASRLMKAAVALSGMTVEEVALAALVRDSRLPRLLSGRTSPDGDEVARVLRACGVHPALLTRRFTIKQKVEDVELISAPSRSPDSQISSRDVPWNVLLAMILLQEPSVVGTTGISSCRLSVDKVALVFTVEDIIRLGRIARTLGVRRPKRSDEDRYAWTYHCNGLLVQHSPKWGRLHSCRIEFNPNHLDSRPLLRWAVHRLHRLIDPAHVRVSWIDVTADLPLSIHDVQALGSPRQKLHAYVGKAGVETIYVGVKGSDVAVKVYDKQQERLDNADDDNHPVLTRFEASVKGRGILLRDLATLENPFAKLRVFHLRPDGLPLARRLLVEYARIVGLPAIRGCLPRDELEALVKDLEISDSKAVAPHPREVFTAQWQTVVASLLQRLGIESGRCV